MRSWLKRIVAPAPVLVAGIFIAVMGVVVAANTVQGFQADSNHYPYFHCVVTGGTDCSSGGGGGATPIPYPTSTPGGILQSNIVSAAGANYTSASPFPVILPSPPTVNQGTSPWVVNTPAPSATDGSGNIKNALLGGAGATGGTNEAYVDANGVQRHTNCDATTSTNCQTIASGAAQTSIARNTGGQLSTLAGCTVNKSINVAATTSNVISGQGAGTNIHICAISLVSTGGTLVLEDGTGTNCGSLSDTLTGTYPSGSVVQIGTGVGQIMQTLTTNTELCVVSGTGGSVQGFIEYAGY